MSDQQIIEAMIARDERVTQQFFFGNCRPLFLSIIRYVFSYEVDYDEFNEFYLRLMENDADWCVFIISNGIGEKTLNEYRMAMNSLHKKWAS